MDEASTSALLTNPLVIAAIAGGLGAALGAGIAGAASLLQGAMQLWHERARWKRDEGLAAQAREEGVRREIFEWRRRAYIDFLRRLDQQWLLAIKPRPGEQSFEDIAGFQASVVELALVGPERVTVLVQNAQIAANRVVTLAQARGAGNPVSEAEKAEATALGTLRKDLVRLMQSVLEIEP